MRKPHILKPTTGSKLPYKLAFVDTETTLTKLSDDVTMHTLKLGYCVITRRLRGSDLVKQSSHIIRSIPEFWDYLLANVTAKTSLTVVMHNLNYDLPVLHAFSELPERGYTLSMFYVKGMTGIIKFRNGDCSLVFLDNANFFSGKLDTWAREIGSGKTTIDFDTTSDDQLLAYCIQDVNILIKLWATWLEFMLANDCGEFKFTLSSTAFNTFRHRFLSNRVFIHSNEPALELERAAYHGGRVECLFVGHLEQGEFYYLDVNNMYGFIMRDHEYPLALIRVVNNPTVIGLEDKLQNYAVIASLSLTTDTPYYPTKYKDRLCYPVGTFDCVLSTPELIQALNDDSIQRVYSMAIYRKGKLFSDYVEYFYAKRLEYRSLGLSGYEQICKLMLNALYGKFGQTGLDQELVAKIDDRIVLISAGKDLDTGLRYEDIRLGGSIIHITHSGESYNSFPAIAAHVTAYARMHLFQLRQIVPDKHVFYMDTDSLIVDRLGLDCLRGYIRPDELGYLKIEHTASDLTIHAPKDYAMGTRKRTKGVRANATQLAANTYEQLQWPKLRGMIRRDQLTDYRTTTIVKRLSRAIHVGSVLPSGFVLPPRLPRRHP